MTSPWWIWIGLGAGGVGGLLSTLQHALREVNRGSLEQAELRRKFAKAGRLQGSNGNGSEGSAPSFDVAASKAEITPSVATVAADLDGHVAAVAVPRIVCNLLLGVSMVLWISSLREVAAPGLVDVASGIGAAAVMTWLLSVVLPLAVARHAAEGAVLSWLWLIRLCHVAIGPLRAVQGFVGEVVRRLAGEEARSDLAAREAELLSLVEASEREGGLDEGARDMIEAVVEFRNTSVEQIMTPRTEVEALEYTDDIAAVKRYAREGAHSRIPVFRDNLDHVEGLLYVKDLFKWMTDGRADRSFVLQDTLRKPTFVPETKTVSELLAELLEEKVHIAIAIDEYGGTSGLVTIEDIVEEVFGEIQDEYDPDEDRTPSVVIDTDAGLATVDARTEIDEANDELEDIGLELPEDDDYDTVGGYVVTRLGKIPEAGEELQQDGLHITVLEAEPTRVLRVSIRRAEEVEASA
ncbi:MAG: hypothetical protein CMJ31_09760 [Phycisphaerae bacterium]|nr:hypothetical protein [Phycisphaerae bacterium]